MTTVKEIIDTELLSTFENIYKKLAELMKEGYNIMNSVPDYPEDIDSENEDFFLHKRIFDKLCDEDSVRLKVIFDRYADGDMLYMKKCINSIDVSEKNFLLKISCINSYMSLCKFIVENGADVHSAKDALYYCIDKNCVEYIEYFLEKGADLSDDKIVFWAMGTNRSDIVHKIIKADLYDKHIPVLEWSISENHFDIFKHLADIGDKLDISGCLEIAINSSNNANTEIIKYIVKKYKQFDIDIPDKVITDKVSDINTIFFMHAKESQHHLFNKQIVETYGSLKSLMKN